MTATCVVGNARLSSLPSLSSVEPTVAGRTMRACSIPGSRISATNDSWPLTMPGITFIGCEVPRTLYWLGGVTGGLPVTVSPPHFVPVVGIVSSSACPATSWP